VAKAERLTDVETVGRLAKQASRVCATLSTEIKNAALVAMAKALTENAAQILAANELDMQKAGEKGISESLLDRLMLDKARIGEMAQALLDVEALPDPVGEIVAGWKVPNGLMIQKVRVPMGVIGVIYEARPNVTVDATALALKGGNACILRGGSLALASNLALTDIISEAAEARGIPAGAIQAISATGRESVNHLMKLDKYVDLLVPRGGEDLINTVVANATVLGSGFFVRIL